MARRRLVFLCLAATVALTACESDAPNQPTDAPPEPTLYAISGTVTSSGGGVVSGATVRIVDGPNANRTTTTLVNGTYTIGALQFSAFTMNVSAATFATASRGVVLTEGVTTRIENFTLTSSAPPPPPPPPADPVAFGPGQRIVNSQIAPGRYFSNPNTNCYWERQSGLGGSFGEIIANEFISFNAGQWIVDILGSDVAFESESECGNWFTTQRRGHQATITQGLWLVGPQVSPGTYSANVQSGCYWERVRDFRGQLAAVIDNDFISTSGPQFVVIAPGDVGFHSDGDCGTWSPAPGAGAIYDAMAPTSHDPAAIERAWRLQRDSR